MSKADRTIPGVIHRLGLDVVAALRFLLFVEIPADAAPDAPRRGVWPIVPLGLLIGMAWVGMFRICWRGFGETAGLRLIPALGLIALDTIVTGRLLLIAMMRLFTDSDGVSFRSLRGAVNEAAALVLLLTIFIQFVFVLSLQQLPGWWPSPDDWRSWFNWMYPQPIYRPLLLAPMWGRWCMLVTLSSGRSNADADSLTRGYGHELRPVRLALHSALPLFLTSIYCSRGGNLFTGPLIAAFLLGVTTLYSTFIAHRRGGQSRITVLAAGLLGQMTFLIVYRAFWRLIER